MPLEFLAEYHNIENDLTKLAESAITFADSAARNL